jgi:hypothetical protein
MSATCEYSATSPTGSANASEKYFWNLSAPQTGINAETYSNIEIWGMGGGDTVWLSGGRGEAQSRTDHAQVLLN